MTRLALVWLVFLVFGCGDDDAAGGSGGAGAAGSAFGPQAGMGMDQPPVRADVSEMDPMRDSMTDPEPQTEPVVEPEMQVEPMEVEPETSQHQLARERLVECGLFTEGEITFTVKRGSTADDCTSECIANSTCLDLDAWFCQLDTGGSVARNCLQGCGRADPRYFCGSGEDIPASFQCDGSPECIDASDEVGCGPEADFRCSDGSSVPVTFECDQVPDCLDGSDEHGGCASAICF